MATYSSIKQSVLEATSIARVIATNYNSVDSLPTSGNVVGEQALVLGDSSTDRLYIWEGSAWYQIALIQNSPTFTTSPDDTYELATDGVTTTVITLAATDPEGFPVTFSAVTNVGFDSIATVSQDSSVFTVTPFSKDSAGVSRTGTITFKASDGISVASAISTFTISFSIENSNYTSALIKASGNSGTNIAINDASASNRTITLNGDISAQAFTPFHPGGYSAYFDGTGDYITVADDATLEWGSSDFTLEFWYNGNDTDQYATLVSRTPGGFSSGMWSIMMNHTSTGDIAFYHGNYSTSAPMLRTTLGSVVDNTWHHIALVRNGNDWALYVDGVSKATITSATNLADITGDWRIGADQNYGRNLSGYISDLRYVKGTAVYTANFTVPSSRLEAITNTELLVCHLPYLADGSSNDHTVTFAGNVALKRFAPYDHIAYDPATHGASIYNDGTGDYMTVPADTTDLTLDGDFTIDFWYYPVAAKNMGYVYGKWNNQSDGWALWVTPNYSSGNFGYVTFYYGNYGSNECASNLRSTVVTLNQWHYIRVTRSSGTMYMSVNGKVGTRTNYTSGITFTDNRTFNADTTIGITGNSVGYTLGEAFLSDLRVINGTALTTGNFTPPTSPATAVTNTKLLTCNDAPNIFDTSGNSRIKTDGATSSTSSTKYANSSIQTSSSDRVYLYPITSSEFDNVTGDFTVEAWIKLDSSTLPYAQILLYRDESNTSGPNINLRFGDSGFGYHLQFNITASGASNFNSVDLTQSNFTAGYKHLALVRTNGIVKVFIDGTHYPTNTGANPSSFPNPHVVFNNTLSAIDRFEVGGSLDGNIEDFRFTKNLARYPFIPPKETLTAVSGTSFLTAHAATITDGSSNSLSITSRGDPTVSNFAPKSGMKSIHFDGNDYLEIADGDYKTFGSDNWTIEAWVYPTSVGSGFGNYFWGDTASSGATNTSSTAALYNSSGKFGAYVTMSNGTILTIMASDLTTPINNWYHVALVRNSQYFHLFVNGAKSAGTQQTGAMLDSGQILTVGRTGAYNGLNFVGYVSNYRIVKGTALYTNSFTPPTLELEA